MNWENVDNDFEEEIEPGQALKQEKESQIQSLLQKFHDPAYDPKRQEYIHFLRTFNQLLLAGQIETIANSMINEDTQLFLFSSLPKGLPVQYSIGPKGFIELFKGRRTVEREVRTMHVDQEKCTAIQICSCVVDYGNEEKLSEEFWFEIFTIKEGRISKYRASFGSLTPAHNKEDPFIVTRKDKMLAKVKMINYALAGQPDFDKVASLLHDKTEYTILSWEADKFHTFYQNNVASEFRKLETNFSIKCIVPYELYTDSKEIQNAHKIVVSTYAYHLEEKTTGNLYVWLSTCAYAFDENVNIIKVSQQGELYPEDDIEIPFETYDREKMTQKMYDFFKNLKANLDLFYNDIMYCDCTMSRLGPHDIPTSKNYCGLDEINKLLASLGPPEADLDWVKPVDVFVDLNDPSYDVVVLVINSQGTFHYEDYKYKGQRMTYIKFVRLAFENGKVAKLAHLLTEVPYSILSPFDDETESGINIRQLKDLENM